MSEVPSLLSGTTPQPASHGTRRKRPRSNSVETVAESFTLDGSRATQSEPGQFPLACPFSKHQPELWGDIGECGTYKTPCIKNMVRHHVLDKHRKQNALLPVGDARRIEPERFEELKTWRKTLLLKQSNKTQLWTKMYMILFAIDDEASVPQPEFSRVLAEKATEMIKGHLERKIIGEPELRARHHAELLAACNRRIDEQQREDRKHVQQYFEPRVQEVHKMYRDELVKCDERAAEKRARLHHAYKAELSQSLPPPTSSYVQFAGSAPSQVAVPSTIEWQSITDELLRPREDRHVSDAAHNDRGPQSAIDSSYDAAELDREDPNAWLAFVEPEP